MSTYVACLYTWQSFDIKSLFKCPSTFFFHSISFRILHQQFLVCPPFESNDENNRDIYCPKYKFSLLPVATRHCNWLCDLAPKSFDNRKFKGPGKTPTIECWSTSCLLNITLKGELGGMNCKTSKSLTKSKFLRLLFWSLYFFWRCHEFPCFE